MTDAAGPRRGRSTVLDPAAPGELSAHSLPLRRARLVRAAVELIAERGFSGTSIARVAGRAGVSRRSTGVCNPIGTGEWPIALDTKATLELEEELEIKA